MSYFYRAVDERREETIEDLIDFLKPREHLFQAIAFRGLSGAMVAPIIAYVMGKKIIPVRKPKTDEDNHSGATVEAPPFGNLVPAEERKILIIDDFIASGKTVATIVKLIGNWDRRAECIGVLQYCRLDPVWNEWAIRPIKGSLEPAYWSTL